MNPLLARLGWPMVQRPGALSFVHLCESRSTSFLFLQLKLAMGLTTQRWCRSNTTVDSKEKNLVLMTCVLQHHTCHMLSFCSKVSSSSGSIYSLSYFTIVVWTNSVWPSDFLPTDQNVTLIYQSTSLPHCHSFSFFFFSRCATWDIRGNWPVHIVYIYLWRAFENLPREATTLCLISFLAVLKRCAILTNFGMICCKVLSSTS